MGISAPPGVPLMRPSGCWTVTHPHPHTPTPTHPQAPRTPWRVSVSVSVPALSRRAGVIVAWPRIPSALRLICSQINLRRASLQETRSLSQRKSQTRTARSGLSLVEDGPAGSRRMVLCCSSRWTTDLHQSRAGLLLGLTLRRKTRQRSAGRRKHELTRRRHQ